MSINGFLFLGPTIMVPSAPGRRIDSDYAAAVSRKVAYALDHAKKHGLKPVFLGPLSNKKFDVRVLASWLNVLDGEKPYCLVRRDDIKGGELDQHSLIGVLAAAGKIEPIGISNEPVGVSVVDAGQESTVYLYPIKEGDKTPNSLGFDEGLPIGHETLITAYVPLVDKSNADGVTPREIPGASLVVNGWSDAESVSNQGATRFVDTGPVTRINSLYEEAEPVGYTWTKKGLERLVLPHEKHVFEHAIESAFNESNTESDFVQMFADRAKQNLEGEQPLDQVLDGVKKAMGVGSEIWSHIDLLFEEASRHEAVGF